MPKPWDRHLEQVLAEAGQEPGSTVRGRPVSAEFRLSDEQREAFALAICQAHDMPEDHEPDACGACEFEMRTVAPLVERIVASEREAARRLGVEQGMLHSGRDVATAYATGLVDGKRNAEAAERALVDLLNYLDRQGCLVHEASCHCIGTTRPCTCRLADLRAALTRPDTEGEPDA